MRGPGRGATGGDRGRQGATGGWVNTRERGSTGERGDMGRQGAG